MGVVGSDQVVDPLDGQNGQEQSHCELVPRVTMLGFKTKPMRSQWDASLVCLCGCSRSLETAIDVWREFCAI